MCFWQQFYHCYNLVDKSLGKLPVYHRTSGFQQFSMSSYQPVHLGEPASLRSLLGLGLLGLLFLPLLLPVTELCVGKGCWTPVRDQSLTFRAWREGRHGKFIMTVGTKLGFSDEMSRWRTSWGHGERPLKIGLQHFIKSTELKVNNSPKLESLGRTSIQISECGLP